VHGFVDYDGNAFWAILQISSVPLAIHVVDPFIPEIAQGQISDFNYAWEQIQADPVDVPDYYDDLDIRKFYYEVDDFESSSNVTFKEMKLDDFSVVGRDTTSPKLIVTALDKASLNPDLLTSVISKIPITSVEVTV
jgi:hypothetical protein